MGLVEIQLQRYQRPKIFAPSSKVRLHQHQHCTSNNTSCDADNDTQRTRPCARQSCSLARRGTVQASCSVADQADPCTIVQNSARRCEHW
ncbi:hypothetical protein HETIRDRAFT_163364 [Heterobasidion irregulare TC 32-1]|uniref:Uncharacterized protein n=1 Tax=Heterobasidion irregulare (strain TC 32-1) TaxID=747525 RepID=W4KB54_HETIT|nr:uncharacterized protein HETIRDRAFT_163364 [Heterobasidion irregulare TC 32-1]ETW82959.1 hypothetical protein HETIRDRAFT_163364 [Heterobasidion irregulare TC 32-1]